MYEATDQTSTAAEHPDGSEIRESDWHILAGFWHPVEMFGLGAPELVA